MQAYREKELSERDELDLVIEIIEKFRKKGISFRQANAILATAQLELQKLPISEIQKNLDSNTNCNYTCRPDSK